MKKNTGEWALDLLKEEINELEYNKYFKSVQFNKSRSTNKAYFYEVPNIFILKWVKTKYQKQMEHIIEICSGEKNEVHFTTPNEVTKVETRPKKETKNKKNSVILNPSFTFGSFVVGHSNQFAFTSAKNIAQKLGTLYNPFFIYGGVGLGKTHLIQAIGNANAHKDYNILYLSTEQLMNDFTKHLTNHTMEKFREKYRSCDLLLIDDVQFLSGKDKFQEEFFHTFEDLRNNNKQIVLTADKKPSDIIGLEERLKSRFQWGLITPIQPPDLETKIGIIKKKCELDGISLTNDIILYIATHLETNIREIEGILIKINAFANMINLEKIDIEFAQSILKDHIKEKRETINIEDIIKTVARELNIKPSEIKSKQRTKKITHARRTVIYLARELTQTSMPNLAQYFGMKDHSAISHGIKKTKELLKQNKDEKLKIEELKNKITNKETSTQ